MAALRQEARKAIPSPPEVELSEDSVGLAEASSPPRGPTQCPLGILHPS